MPSIFHRAVTTVVLVVVAVLVGRGLWRIHAQRAAIDSQVQDLSAKVDHAREDNQQLASSSAYFQSNDYLEKQARLTLNYKLPDEQVAFVYRDTSVKTPPASASRSVADEVGLSALGRWFKNLFK